MSEEVLVSEDKLTAIGTAIRTKKGSSNLMTLDEMATEISTIPSGGSAVTEKDVNFIDFDGTLKYSYTYTEALALTELPAGPDHTSGTDTDGVPLTFDGWNWTLQEIKDYMAANRGCVLTVGANYHTTDGAEHIITTLIPANTTVTVTNGLVSGWDETIEWGDGTSSDVYSGTITHTYSTYGSYDIKIRKRYSGEILGSFYGCVGFSKKIYVTSNINDLYITNYNFLGSLCLNRYSSTRVIQVSSNPCLRALVLPRGSTESSNTAFNDSKAIEIISYPGDYAGGDGTFSIFYNSNSLKHLAIPSNLTSLGGSGAATGMFTQAQISIKEFVVPPNITAMRVSQSGSYPIPKVVLKPSTPPNAPTISPFYGNRAILVPPGAKSAYENATNWSAYAGMYLEDLIISSCESLTITADDIVTGYDTTTTVHATAVINGTSLDGLETYTSKTITFTDTVTVPTNPSTTESITQTISYTWNGQTATTTITHGKWYDRTRTVDDTNWTNSTYWSNPDPDNYDYYASQQSTTYDSQYIAITISGYANYSLRIGGYTIVKMGSIPKGGSYDFKSEGTIWGSSLSYIKTVCSWTDLDPAQSYTIYVAHSYAQTAYYYSANVLIPKVPS